MRMKSILTKRNYIIFSILFIIVGTIYFRGILTNSIYLPKPKGYIRIDIPEHKYLSIQGNYPYSFEYSQHAKIINKDIKGEKFYIDIFYPKFSASVHITYKEINNNQVLLRELWNEFYHNLSLHYQKASSVDEQVIKNKYKNEFVVIELKGKHIASQYQFITSDKKNHFLVGVLYFNQLPDQEFLNPMINFIKKDITHLINTFRWK